MRNLFYRNVRARGHLGLFFSSALATIFVLRLFLFLTGYPQVGGGTLHIAHMLYGGFFMMTAIVMMVTFLGERVRNFSALLGGIGFGLFIDELGKFITKDNNYFFRPTIGLLYALFAGIFLVFNYIGRQSNFSDREYELNALNQIEEALLQDLDPLEKRRIMELLRKIKHPTHITETLQHMLKTVETVPVPRPRLVRRALAAVTKTYIGFWNRPRAAWLITIIFVGQSLVFLGTVSYTLYASYNTSIGLNTLSDGYINRLLLAEFASTAISAALAIAGAFQLFSSRLQAYDIFRNSLLINIFLSEFFLFTRIQFAALPSLVFNILLLVALYGAIDQERRLHHLTDV